MGVSDSRETVFVYIIAHAEGRRLFPPLKVGVAGNVQDRLKALQIGNPGRLAIVGQFACPSRDIALGLEDAFHRVKGAHALRGEWFDMDVFKALRAMCENIKACLKYTADLDEEEMRIALEISGVTKCEGILSEVMRSGASGG
jgi:hypothetical protein